MSCYEKPQVEYFWDSCDTGISELPELKKLFNSHFVEVENLKNNSNTPRSD